MRDELQASAARYSKKNIESDEDPFYEGFNEEKEDKEMQLRSNSNNTLSPNKAYIHPQVVTEINDPPEPKKKNV
jgi:hypothetical protein